MPRRAEKPPRPAVIEREYGPFPSARGVAGVTFDGQRAWFAAGDQLQSFDLDTGESGRAWPVAADAGTAFDGKHFYQLAAGRIQKIAAENGRVISSVAVGAGVDDASGLTWAEGTLWVGRYGARKIHQLDPDSGRILRTIESDRFVTGVTFLDDELWHATDENSESELRHVDVNSGEVLQRLLLPAGVMVSGLEAIGRPPRDSAQASKSRFLCGGGKSGKVRAVRGPR